MQTIKQESEKYRFILEKACCDGISVNVRNEILKLKHKKLIYIYIYTLNTRELFLSELYRKLYETFEESIK